MSKKYCCALTFLAQIDSLLSQRSEGEHEASRRLKTEFLIQLVSFYVFLPNTLEIEPRLFCQDGAATTTDERLLIVGATNRPQELDEAARRRFVKRLYIPLPDAPARSQV